MSGLLIGIVVVAALSAAGAAMIHCGSAKHHDA
mgnify:CR=1 FL=1